MKSVPRFTGHNGTIKMSVQVETIENTLSHQWEHLIICDL